MVEVKVILKNGQEIEFIAKDKVYSSNDKVVVYKTEDNTIHTVTVNEIAVISERQFRTKDYNKLSEKLEIMPSLTRSR